MIFKLKCKNCGNIVLYDSNEEKISFKKCDHCSNTMIMNVETKLDNVAELEGFELLGIQRNYTSKLLGSDLDRIEEIFESSNSKRQETIAKIIDKLYLILNRNDDKLDTELNEVLKTLF